MMTGWVWFFFYLYETAVPQPGVDLEDSLTREAVKGTLKQDTACRPQETILEDKRTAEHSGDFLNELETDTSIYRSSEKPAYFLLCFFILSVYMRQQEINKTYFLSLSLLLISSLHLPSLFFSPLTSLSDLRLSEAATAGVVRPTLPFVVT